MRCLPFLGTNNDGRLSPLRLEHNMRFLSQNIPIYLSYLVLQDFLSKYKNVNIFHRSQNDKEVLH